jgi:hypothetical protein
MTDTHNDGILILPEFTPVHLFRDKQPETMQIVSDAPTGFTIINACDFDPATMKRAAR